MSPGASGTGSRALLVTLDFPPTRGGIQTMTREIVNRVDGFDWHVVAPADPGHEEVDPTLGAEVRRARSLGGSRRGFVASVNALAFRGARRIRPDVGLAIHALAAPGLMLARAPVIVFVHGGELRSPRIARVARLVLPRARAVVANSSYTRAAATALGADPETTHVVRVGAPDPPQVSAERVAETRARYGGSRLLLSVGRLAPHKGFDVLIRACRDIPDDVRAVIVGDGPERAPLEALAQREGVAAKVTFAGAVADEELAALYAASDAFALLSRETSGPRAGVEGGGIALLEALAAGLPVVAAATGGIPETIRDAETGLLVDPDDGSAVVRALRRVMDDRDLAGRLAEAGRALATGDRSWKSYADRIKRIMTQVAVPAT